MDKIVRINMSGENGPTISTESLGPYAGLGGRALTSTIVAEEVPATCHPLGKDNKLVIAPGLLSGSAGAMTGRISVGCKSPLTGGIKEANSGGQPSQMLARMGIAAIVLEGLPKDDTLYKVKLTAADAVIMPDNSLKKMGNYDTVEKLKQEYGDKVAFITIGQAGEMKMAAASIAFTDMELRPTRHAGRGGVGAVMGSKGVKAIIIDDSGTKVRSPADPESFKAANKAWVAGLQSHAVTGKGLPAFGTNSLTDVVNEAGAFPTFNFKQGQFEHAGKIGGPALAKLENSRGGEGSATHGCHRGCIIKCSGTYYDKDGNFVTKQPEYETVWAHGGNCGIHDLDVIAQLDRMDDDFGLDTIEMGAAVGVAMEAGIAAFGDGQAAINLIKEVGKGTPLGRIIGNGAAMVGKAFGITRVPVVKNQALPAYDPRAVQGIGVTYATTTMGADHTAGYAVTANVLGVGGKVDGLKPEGQVELSRNLQIATAGIDSVGMCLFVAFATLDIPEAMQAMLDLIAAFTGNPMSGDDFAGMGKKVLEIERDFNKRAGLTAADDRLPEFFKNEPIAPHNVTFGVSDEELDSVFKW